MAVVTRTIGTASRHYSTIAAWEADLDNGAIYSASDDAVGECYNDSAFDEAVTFNGGGTVGLASVTLSVAAGERHDGTAGTGARIVRSAAAGVTLNISRSNFIIEWLELDRASNADPGTTTGIQVNAPTPIIRNMILHGIRSTDGNCYGIVDTNDNFIALNNILYEIFNEATGSAPCVGIGETGGSARNYTAQNNTVHRVRNDNGTGVARGLQFIGGTLTVQNNLITGTTGTTSGAITDFNSTGQSYNASSDASASGTGSLTNVVIADQYVSTTIGSEDLHVKSGADVIDAGTDLGTSNGVNIDINGNDRAGATTWDIGAHEYELSAAGGSDVTVTGTPDTLVITEQTGSVLYNVSVTGTSDTLVITEQSATVSVTNTVEVVGSPDGLLITEQQATINYNVTVTGSPATLTITEQTATITDSVDVTVTGNTASLTLQEQAATVTYTLTVTGIPDTLVINEQTGSVNINVDVVGTPDTLAINEQTASIVYDVTVNGIPATLTITEQSATILAPTKVIGVPDALIITTLVAGVSTGLESGLRYSNSRASRKYQRPEATGNRPNRSWL